MAKKLEGIMLDLTDLVTLHSLDIETKLQMEIYS